MLSNAPYDCTVVARSTLRVLTLSASDFLQLTRKHQKLKRRFETVAAKKGQKLKARARRLEGRASGPEPAEDLDYKLEAPILNDGATGRYVGLRLDHANYKLRRLPENYDLLWRKRG